MANLENPEGLSDEIDFKIFSQDSQEPFRFEPIDFYVEVFGSRPEKQVTDTAADEQRTSARLTDDAAKAILHSLDVGM
jgi:hypothetical protein